MVSFGLKPAAISALASGLLYLSHPKLAARVSTSGSCHKRPFASQELLAVVGYFRSWREARVSNFIQTPVGQRAYPSWITILGDSAPKHVRGEWRMPSTIRDATAIARLSVRWRLKRHLNLTTANLFRQQGCGLRRNRRNLSIKPSFPACPARIRNHRN